MAHYYAFCQKHGKCGSNRDTENEAWDDVNHHYSDVSGFHGQIFVKLSSSLLDPITGLKKFRYRSIKTK